MTLLVPSLIQFEIRKDLSSLKVITTESNKEYIHVHDFLNDTEEVLFLAIIIV